MATDIIHLDPRNRVTNRFLSLKWKSVIVVSIIILLVNIGYFYFQHKTLNNQFDEVRNHMRLQNIRMLTSITQQSARDLQNIGNLIPSMYNMRRLLDENRFFEIERRLGEVWPTIQVENDVDGILFFDSFAKNIFKPSINQYIDYYESEIRGYVTTVNATQSPISILKCHQVCFQISIVPYLSKTSKVTAIAIYTSIADLTLRFSSLAAVDIGLLRENTGTSGDENILPWHVSVSALTNKVKNLPLLQEIASANAITDLTRESTIVSQDDLSYEIYMVDFQSIGAKEAGYAVIIRDVTKELQKINAVTSDGFLISIAGLILSEFALLLLLWNPLSRLKSTSLTLPLLAAGKFGQARNELTKKQTLKKWHIDEIDLVNLSAVDLANQLEKLNTEIAQYTESLAENMIQLQSERDFTAKLLETAQVIIVTQSDSGKILHVNRYGLSVQGGSQEEITGKYFSDVFLPQKDITQHQAILCKIRDQKYEHLKDEASFISKTGIIKTIAWIHSFVSSPGEDGVAILSIGTDITDRKESERRITWLANHDPLTGLYNRRYFNEVFGNFLRKTKRDKRTGALLFIDLDNFKYINDTQGHQAGDTLIKNVALALKRITRETDIISRIGGDEFAIVIQDINTEGAIDFCRDLNKRINSVVRRKAGKHSNTSTSIGVAMFPEHGTSVNELLANADIAMYQAKEKGKGDWHLFSVEEQARERIQTQVNWKEKIDYALKHDNFLLYFQPIMNIKTSEVTHYEVLLRMRDSNGSVLSPHPFIKVAESTGLIRDIDHLVVQKTIAAIKQNGHLNSAIKYSINLSAQTFSDRKNLPTLKKLLKNSHVPMQSLIFEITETAALQDLNAARDLIDELQAMGCFFAIDDFGVGFSSFYYLRELPVDYVKIDGSFIQQLAKNADDQLIVRAMSEIVQGFGKKTIAEYVEDAKTLELLKRYKVDYAQGYYIGTPEIHTNWEREYG